MVLRSLAFKMWVGLKKISNLVHAPTPLPGLTTQMDTKTSISSLGTGMAAKIEQKVLPFAYIANAITSRPLKLPNGPLHPT